MHMYKDLLPMAWMFVDRLPVDWLPIESCGILVLETPERWENHIEFWRRKCVELNNRTGFACRLSLSISQSKTM